MAHGDAVADLDEVGEVGGDVEDRAGAAAGKIRQQADIGLLGEPRRGGLEVVQKDLGHGVIRQDDGGAAGQHVLPQQAQGAAAVAGDVLQRPQGRGGAGRQPVQPVQQQHGGGTHLH